MLPDLISLQCFVEAARTKSFRAAARAVALTPAALGKRIQRLEHELGLVLFQRSTRSVALTLDGIRLLPAAEAALDAACACASVARGGAAPRLDLTLGTRHELGVSWIIPQIDFIEREIEHLTIHLYFGSGADLLVRLRTREIDCAISSMRTDDPTIDSIAMHREDYAFVAAPALARKIPLTRPEDTRAHVLLDVSHELPLLRYLRDALPGNEPRFSRVVRLGSIEAIRARVLAGKGVAVLPTYFVEDLIRQKKLVRLLTGTELTHDYFRLQFRAGDPRRSVFEALAAKMGARSLC
jgi:LysR family glycine cleavage system transcriptional activator